MRGGRLSLFWWTIISTIGLYILLEYILPYLSMMLAGSQNPLPLPAAAMFMYLLLILMGVFIYVTSSEERLGEFLSPIIRFLKGGQIGPWGWVRIGTLIAVPIFSAWIAYAQTIPKMEISAGIRIQHPTMPGQFEKLNNPFRNSTDKMVEDFMEKENLKNVSIEEGRKSLIKKYVEEGIVLYQKNCRPCHGVAAGGDGPMARAFRLKPANFRDPGTIATVVEPFAFWRASEGAPGLPNEATSWDSIMPAWKNDLTKEEIWKIVMAEYDISGTEPRIPEKLGE